ncbi:MAG: carbonic anhydrase [Desulfobacteraceae bacterium]|jgi:carbonic anhydrase
MKKLVSLLIALLFVFSTQSVSIASEAGAHSVSGKESHKMMIEGNKRYVADKATHKHQDSTRRMDVTGGQHPFAVVISCSDSRVPPEIIFDQGIGDLFVIRLAGNIVDDAALGSIEYAIEHLGTKYIMVLGHESCGAVKATVDGGEAPGHIGCIVKAIKPAIDSVRGRTADLPEVGMRANVAMTVQMLKTADPFLKPLFEKGELMIVGARYDLDDGRVDIMP